MDRELNEIVNGMNMDSGMGSTVDTFSTKEMGVLGFGVDRGTDMRWIREVDETVGSLQRVRWGWKWE